VSVAPILIVDDDLAARELLATALRLSGFSAVQMPDGLGALNYLRAGGEASAILLDLVMPVMDGFEFRREQRKDPRLANIPVVVLSALASVRGDELEPSAALDKPVDVFEVADLVRRVAQTH
jgi:CheY-like chemotaxis protein